MTGITPRIVITSPTEVQASLGSSALTVSGNDSAQIAEGLRRSFARQGLAAVIIDSKTNSSEPSSAQPRTPHSGGSRIDEGSDITSPEAAE